MNRNFQSAVKGVIGEKYYARLSRRYYRLKTLAKDPSFLTKYAFGNMLDVLQLREIGKYQGTDKVEKTHFFDGLTYLDIYEKYVHSLRDKDISVLEIGVRTGASLKTWRSYFKNGAIYGIDIDPRCKGIEDDRIKIEIGSQDDKQFLTTCFGPDTKFDLIIDDGSHINSFTIASFDVLFNQRLKPGGIYVIEDLHCSYDKLQTDQNILDVWPGMKYNDLSKSFDNDREEMDRFFFQKIRDLDHAVGNILCIHFWAMTCVIMKTHRNEDD